MVNCCLLVVASLGGCTPARTVDDAAEGGGCFRFDLSTLTAPAYMAADAYPESYLLANPCSDAAATARCAACGSAAPSPGYQLQPGAACTAGTRCDALGSGEGVASGDSGGLTISWAGGAGGRAMRLLLDCNASAPTGRGPALVVEGPPLSYTVRWPAKEGCPTRVASGCTSPPPPPPAPVAVPSAAQLAWMQDGMGAIGHFNMGTFEACGIGEEVLEGRRRPGVALSLPPPSTFAPTDVDVDAWVAALASFGARRAVLVVSHGCGFNTFPSRTAFPEFGFEYNYSVANSPWKGGKGDIAREFVDACRKYGIRPGFYHGAMNNAFLGVVSGKVSTSHVPGQARITQEQYTRVLLANLRQLWTDYGPLAEVWFDGGYPEGTAEPIASLLAELQPGAVGFQGPGRNVIRWAGTESGHVKPPYWSAAESSLTAGAGAASAPVFSPAECDTCFQGGRRDLAGGAPYGGCWFYNADLEPKSLAELVSTYHDSLGSNCFLLLDWTPTQAGSLRKDHVQRYAEFGSFLASCYGDGAAVAQLHNASLPAVGSTVALTVPAGKEVDRVVLREDQRQGQRVLGWTIATAEAGTVATGQSIGNQRIVLLRAPVVGPARIQVAATKLLGGGALLASVGLYNCSRVPTGTGCSTMKNFAYTIVPSIVVGSSAHSTVSQCCSRCRANAKCAVFVLDPAGTCTELSANQGGGAAAGSTSGAPQR